MTTTPNFELGQDHLDLREWVHNFAADVVRPAAAEWDEKEEFPWPVVEEAAKAGLYSVDFIVAQATDETGLGFPISMEEFFSLSRASLIFSASSVVRLSFKDWMSPLTWSLTESGILEACSCNYLSVL